MLLIKVFLEKFAYLTCKSPPDDLSVSEILEITFNGIFLSVFENSPILVRRSNSEYMNKYGDFRNNYYIR
jgi:hypothetical protein